MNLFSQILTFTLFAVGTFFAFFPPLDDKLKVEAIAAASFEGNNCSEAETLSVEPSVKELVSLAD